MDSTVKARGSVAAESESQRFQNHAPSDCKKAEPSSTARLIVRRTSVKSGRRHFYLYDVEFGGELIVIGSADPECDLARRRYRKGHRHNSHFDGKTGKHRTTVNIEKAALLTVRETEREGPRLVQWKPLEPGDGPPGSGEGGWS